MRASSDYPADYGFGHEEWNNADFMRFDDGQEPFRVFHTLDIARAVESDGSIFLFMYASHDGLQQLVGVPGKATCLRSNERRPEREDLVRRLGMRGRWHEAWELENVRLLNANDPREFRRWWNDEAHWTPSWKCPEDCFF